MYFDCGGTFEYVKITDDGIVNYNLSELEYTITCDGTAYNAETGELNMEKYGNYNVELVVADKSSNKTTFAFTVKINPLRINNNLDEVIEMDCGTLFNVNDYFSENLKIVNADETTEYNWNDFDYTIDCPETVYNAASGKLGTGKFGEYDATMTINLESLIFIEKKKAAVKKIWNAFSANMVQQNWNYD